MLNLLEDELSAVSKLPPCAVVKLAPCPSWPNHERTVFCGQFHQGLQQLVIKNVFVCLVPAAGLLLLSCITLRPAALARMCSTTLFPSWWLSCSAGADGRACRPPVLLGSRQPQGQVRQGRL
jgi:hypothetical protein